MADDPLRIENTVHFEAGRLLLGLSGWMDGGDVSTGVVDWLASHLEATTSATIAPEPFNLYNLPGSMEVAALFRPYVKIEDGLLTEFEVAANTFYAVPEQRLLLFRGKEPNLHWPAFADAVFALARDVGIETIYFVGSVGGAVPHTREPRVFSTVSDPGLKEDLARIGARFTDYEGPASFTTYLLHEAPRRGVRMAGLVAEIPAYIQGTNPVCIVAMIRKVCALLDMPAPVDDLQQLATKWEKRVNRALAKKPDLLEHIRKLEADYDNEVFETQMGDLKEWLEQQGIRVD